MPDFVEGNGLVYAILAVITGLTVGIRTAGPPLIDIIREWRRPDNADFQETMRVRSLLRRTYESIYGTPAYATLSQALREDLEAEFTK